MVSLIGDPHIRLSQSAFVFLLENLLLQYAFLRVLLFCAHSRYNKVSLETMTVLHCRKKLIMRSTRSFNLSIIIDGIFVPGKVGPKALKLQSHNLIAIRVFF